MGLTGRVKCNAPDSRAHQTRRSWRNSRSISAEVALPRLQSEIKVAWFLFASQFFLQIIFVLW